MQRLEALVARWSDRRLALSISAVLFATVAWPIFFLEIPPYQDLPGHLASVTILSHPDRYPDYISNGWLKSNTALIAWTYVVGKVIGIKLAGRLFVLGTLAANALELPRFVLHFTDRRRMWLAAPFAWPMVHNWFVSMGMINFALAVALGLEMLVLLDRQLREPTRLRACGIALLSVLTWYSSSVPLCLVALLVVIEVGVQTDGRARFEATRRLGPPLAPAGVLVGTVFVYHVTGVGGAHFGAVVHLSHDPPIWALHDAWAHWMYAFTELEAVTLVPALALVAFAVVRARAPVRFFSVWALGALGVLYALLPSMMPGFGYVRDRVLPFLWAAALVRIPDRLPRHVWEAALGAGVVYAAALAVDLFRLARDQDSYTAGLSAVPEGSRLLALTFAARVTSKNTWNLRHASGIYVVERLTTAQDVWADSPTMPLRFRETPTFFLDQLLLERFVGSVATRASYCRDQTDRGLQLGDCRAEWRAAWDRMWQAASERFDRVLLFAPTTDALSTVPSTWRPCFRKGLLVILEPAR
jgi:hypothetical protein